MENVNSTNRTNANSKIALITGGSRGLGRNAALHLVRRGVDVILTYRSRQAEAESARARAAIDCLPPSTYKESLLELAAFAVARTF